MRKCVGLMKTVLAAGVAAVAMAGVAVAEKAATGPAMWKLADDDSTIYLFGTFHILPPDVEWETAAYDAAMKDAETTITEADTESPEAQAAVLAGVQQYGLNPPGVTLSSILGEDRAASFSDIAAEYGVSMQMLEPYRPWLASLTLSVVAMQKAGFDPNSGVEKVLLAQAAQEGDAVEHFETATEQLEMLASLDDEEMLANFDATTVQFNEFDEIMDRMLTAWRTGDTETLEKDIIGLVREDAPDAFQKLFVDRNKKWTVLIQDILADEGDTFIAVGAGHLVGEDSVIDLLEEEGLKIERVQ